MRRIGGPQRNLRRWGWTALGVAVTFVILFPVYWMFNVSFMRQVDIIAYPPPFVPPHPTVSGYTTALTASGTFFISSSIYGIGTVVVTMLVAAPAAYALATMQARIASWVIFALVLVQMVPGFVIANSLYIAFVKLNLIGSYEAVILADSTVAVPFAIIITSAFMAGIPRELADAAAIDGAGLWRTFVAIYLPLSTNALITSALFAFLWGWGDFLFALVLNNNPAHVPITVGIYNFISVFSVNWPAVMATAVIGVIPATLLLVLAQRYVTAGVTTGALNE